MQIVEIELDPEESAVGEASSMMYMEDGTQMERANILSHQAALNTGRRPERRNGARDRCAAIARLGISI